MAARAAGLYYLNWWTTEERLAFHALFFTRPPDQVFLG
jgi:hypothetical protein